MKQNIVHYPKESLKPQNLPGISDAQINDHWSLYVGYVNNVNKLNEELITLTQNNQQSSFLYADRRRRYGFEYNGMVLHELYFEALSPNGKPLHDVKLKEAFTNIWGSYDLWCADFIATGKSRSIGWAILYHDTSTDNLLNIFIHEHEHGHIAGYTPLLVMDIWEHAYMVDHKSGERADYINAFMQNINWDVISTRFTPKLSTPNR